LWSPKQTRKNNTIFFTVDILLKREIFHVEQSSFFTATKLVQSYLFFEEKNYIIFLIELRVLYISFTLSRAKETEEKQKSSIKNVKPN